MKKKIYEKPSMKVVLLRHQAYLLAGSQTPPNDAPNYDDWLSYNDGNNTLA